MAGRALNPYQSIWRRSPPISAVPRASPAEAVLGLAFWAAGTHHTPYPTLTADGDTWEGEAQASLGSQLLENSCAGTSHLASYLTSLCLQFLICEMG